MYDIVKNVIISGDFRLSEIIHQGKYLKEHGIK